MILRFIILAFCIWITGSSLSADQVILKNRDHLSGIIVQSDAKSLSLKTDYAGTVIIQWDAIQELSSSQPVYLTTNKGDVFVGVVDTHDGSFNVATKEHGTVTLAKDAVHLIRSEEDQKGNEARIERLKHPLFMDYWSGAVDSGLAMARGNSDTTTFSTGVNVMRTTSANKLTLYAKSLFTEGRVSGKCSIPPGATLAPSTCVITTASALRGGTRYDLNISEKTFAFGQVDLERDRFQQLKLRTALGSGFGYHAIKSARTTFDLQAGVSFDHDNFYTGLKRSAGEALVGEQIVYKITKGTTLKEGLQFFPNLSDMGEYRFNYEFGIATQLSKGLSWQTSFSDRFISNPALGVMKNDVLLTTGIRVIFGNKHL